MNLRKFLRLFDSHKSLPFRTKAYSPAIPTVFMHIPKTAGTDLIGGLTDAIAPRRTVAGFDRVLFGSFEDFDSIDIELRRSIYLDTLRLPADADFVSGHISFSTLSQRYKNAQYVTILREPVSRILSHWLYWRSLADDPLWGNWGERVDKSKGSLTDFLRCPDIACQMDNLYVRMLLWPHRLIPNDDFIDERLRHDDFLVDEAIARLRMFAYVDVLENPRHYTNLQDWLGRPVVSTLANETVRIPGPLRTPLHLELRPEVFDLFALRTRLDLRLWTAVAQQSGSPLSPESLRMRAMMLNAARHSSLVAP